MIGPGSEKSFHTVFTKVSKFNFDERDLAWFPLETKIGDLMSVREIHNLV